MSKQKIIGQIRIRGERDPLISDGALRLLFRLCSHIYTNPKATLEKSFPLPWSTVAAWCWLKDDKSAARRIKELQDNSYIKCDGLRGCPPINHFFLLPNCPSGGAIDCPSGGAHHISNSLREDKIKRKRGEFNGSLRSKETNGDELAASPTGKMSFEQAAQKMKAALEEKGLSHLAESKPTSTVALPNKSNGGQKPLLRKKHE